MAYEAILYDKADHVATITLNRPEALNAFSAQLSADLLAALRESDADPDVRCIILTGAGRAFSAGSDLKASSQRIEQNAQAAEPPSPVYLPVGPREGAFDFIVGGTKPVIAAINGVAVGMGATYPLACDLRTMAESARIGFIFIKRGLTPEYGSMFFLPRVVGIARANELFLTGRFIYAQEAKEIGLVNEVYPDSEFLERTKEFAKSIADNPPIQAKFIKRGMRLSLDSSLASVMEYERWAFAYSQKTEDYREAIGAFMAKREPVFKGR